MRGRMTGASAPARNWIRQEAPISDARDARTLRFGAAEALREARRCVEAPALGRDPRNRAAGPLLRVPRRQRLLRHDRRSGTPLRRDPFRDVAAEYPALADSKYLHRLRELESNDGELPTYPGSPLLALYELANGASYLFCDLDPDSVGNLESEAQSLGVTSARCLAADGMTAVADYVASATGRVLVHIDPYDPRVLW